MKIHLLKVKANRQQIQEMEETLNGYIKVAVDIEKGVLAGGGALHADCEAILLREGSKQENIWGANWIARKKRVTFDAMLNLVPRRNNRAMEIRDAKIRSEVEKIIRGFLEI